MRASFTLFSVCLYALLSSGTSSGDDRRWLMSLVDLVELDYEDNCEQRATASWNELIGAPKGLAKKLERDKAFGILSRQQTAEVKSAVSPKALASDDLLKRRVKLLLQPGDTLLEPEQWIRLVTFGNTALHKLRFATDYYCGTQTNCTLRELNRNMAKQHDEDVLLRMKNSWEQKLPNQKEYLEHILPLLRNASKENGYKTVEEYWDSLAEYEGALLKVREIWDYINPLYVKLHKYIALKLKGADAVGKPLPVHLLKSLNGDDWSNIIENLLPERADIYQKLHVHLRLQEFGGLKAFKQAENLLKFLEIGEIEPEIFAESYFNGSCPTSIVDSCKPNKLRFVTCGDVSLVNYIEAHEAVTKLKYKITSALHSNNTYVLREATRYSAIYEAIPGFISLLSLNPHTLDRAKLYPLERFNYNPNYHRLVLQLIIALRDLPKLNYYIAADEWRLKVLTGTIPSSKVAASWKEFRANFSMLETSNKDILGDSYVLFNKPFVGKFMGIILKYQIYQSFAEELISDDYDLVKHVMEKNERLIEPMIRGFSAKWPEMVSDLLAKRENSLEYTGLTDYFRLLDEYLDNQLDPSTDSNDIAEYVDPPETDVSQERVPDENDIPINQNNIDLKQIPVDTNGNIMDNVIDTGGDTHNKFSFETSTVGVLEIKNPVATGEQNEETRPKEASYNTYWWIGIGVALVVIIALVAIIARKRHSHRKQLERQRRENTVA
ncbi:angiotensin-converting enzyme [Papilio machaon]|uniref:angiotensin-converting enzyme n=1 Tax=Papilio machaon TaxID=76193 RepID=UPI001E6633B1|nr:angiotensin-converting enzyme [Papilio machaon]